MEELRISETIQADLLASAKWLNFLTIVCIVMMALVAMAGVSFMLMPSIEGMPGKVIGIVYLLLPLLYVYPIKKMLGFVRNTRNAVSVASQTSLEDAFKDMHSVLKYWGIFTIVMLAFYAIAIIVGLCAFVLAMVVAVH